MTRLLLPVLLLVLTLDLGFGQQLLPKTPTRKEIDLWRKDADRICEEIRRIQEQHLWSSGNFNTTARLVSSRSGKVVLEKNDGSTISISVSKLSDLNQETVKRFRSLTKEKSEFAKKYGWEVHAISALAKLHTQIDDLREKLSENLGVLVVIAVAAAGLSLGMLLLGWLPG